MTAAITWILSIYPVLARRRNLARDVALLQRTERWRETVAADDGATALTDVLSSLTEQVIFVRNDYFQFPITYYFHPPDRTASLAVALPQLAVFAEQASHHPSVSVQLQAARLREAVRDLTIHLAETFLGLSDASMERVLTAYAVDHLRHVEPAVQEAGDALDKSS